MPAFTAATRNAQLDWLTGIATPPATAPRFVTIFNGDPQAGGTEVLNTVKGSATRLAPSLGAAVAGLSSNTVPIVITAAAVGGATVTHVAIMSAQTGGVVMASGPVVAPKTVGVGDGLSIPAGFLTLSIG